MPAYAQLVIGPAGSGKSTYCETVRQHCETIGRKVHVVNLDPAAEDFAYPVAFDVRDLITVEDAMEELGLGPNGALLYCMEHLEDSLEDWLGEELSAFGDDDYLLFDCPGQVELYSHVSCFRSLADYLSSHDVRACAVYCLDVQFAASPSKFVAGCLAALAAMVCLEMPHVNVLTKVDLLPKEGKRALRRYLIPDANELSRDLAAASALGAGGSGIVEGGSGVPSSNSNNGAHARRTRALDEAVVRLLDDWALVSFVPLDRSGAPLGGSDDEYDGRAGEGGDASSALGIERRAVRNTSGDEGDGFYTPGLDEGAGVAAVLAHIDHAIQFGEDADVKIAPDREEAEEAGGDE